MRQPFNRSNDMGSWLAECRILCAFGNSRHDSLSAAKGDAMFVDTDLLRMGAGFAQSAGSIAEQGAIKFSNAQLPAGIFGDFDAAHNFHRALAKAHETHVATMHSHRAGLDTLSERAISAAAAFLTEDESSEASVDQAGCRLT